MSGDQDRLHSASQLADHSSPCALGQRLAVDRSSVVVRLDRVRPDRRFPLRAAVGADLGVLVASIRARGVVQPIVVEPDGDGYVIREGHRRAAAAVLAGLTEIPALVQDRPLSPQAWLLQQAAESASCSGAGQRRPASPGAPAPGPGLFVAADRGRVRGDTSDRGLVGV